MAHPIPSEFFSPPPSLWHFAFWGGWVAISLYASVGLYFERAPNLGPALVSLGCTAFFVGVMIWIWRDRLIKQQHPAVVVSKQGLLFWRGSARERLLSWENLRGARIKRGISGEIEFVSQSNAEWSAIFKPALKVPIGTASRGGIRLSEALPAILDNAPPTLARPITKVVV